jgi:hypothetical protein
VIASSFTLDSSSLKTEHSSTFYGAIYRRWHSLHFSVLLVRFVTHKFVLQTLPLTVINPQTFSSNSGEEITRVVKVTCVLSPRIMRLTFIQAQHTSNSLPSGVSSEIVLPPPRKSIIDQYRCNFTEMSSISYASPSPIPFFSAVSENSGGENIVGENMVSERICYVTSHLNVLISPFFPFSSQTKLPKSPNHILKHLYQLLAYRTKTKMRRWQSHSSKWKQKTNKNRVLSEMCCTLCAVTLQTIGFLFYLRVGGRSVLLRPSHSGWAVGLRLHRRRVLVQSFFTL